jgi:hypothetical protein
VCRYEAPPFNVKGDRIIMCGEKERTRKEANFKTVKSMGLWTDNVARKADIQTAQRILVRVNNGTKVQ